MERTVIAIFREKNQAESAIRSMKENGFDDNEISLLARDEGSETEDREESGFENQNLADGSSVGGVLGGLTGLLAGAGALLIPGIGPVIAAGPLAGALTGVITGGVAGGLIDYGIPEERGEHYEQRVKEGNVLLTIHVSEDMTRKASKILKRNGAQEVETH